MITISDNASSHIDEIRKKENIPENRPLRISVKEGGCSGFSYKLDFDETKTEKDKSFTAGGIPLLIEKKSLLYIMGLTLDYEGGLNGKGFIFSNPNAKETCGCGVSFGV